MGKKGFYWEDWDVLQLNCLKENQGSSCVPRTAGNRSTAAAGTYAICLGLSAHSLHSLSLQIGFLPVAGHTASGPGLACMALLYRLEKALWWKRRPRSCRVWRGEGTLVKRKRHFAPLNAGLCQGPRFSQQKQVRFQPKFHPSPTKYKLNLVTKHGF